nr:ATP-dependent DNA helicase PIF1-like [Tanacetum cinerariifolium]
MNDQIQPIYRAVCEALGLMGDDKEWGTTLKKLTASGSSKEIRILSAQILIYCDVADPNKLWLKHWEAMSHDIPSKILEATGIPNYYPVRNFLVEADLIIWDEAPMNDRWCFETLNRTLRHLMDAPSLLFGRKTVVLGGDFCQTLLVKIGAGKDELIAASDVESHLWWHFKAIPIGRETSKTELLYPMQYLNTITFPGFPPHELKLKVGSPIMLLRNVNLSRGLCNGTRMIVKSLMQQEKMSETTIASLKISQENYILEAKVYRKWISKSVPEMKELAFCCILMDKEKNKIQVNMDINNIDYSDPLLKLQVAYRFSDFICEKTKPYQQTLANEISLKFKKITKFETLTRKESEFPDNHFKFIAYNQLPLRIPYRHENSNIVYRILTGGISPSLQCGMTWQNNLTKKRFRSYHTQSSLLSALAELTNTKGIRFTCEALIKSVNENRGWKNIVINICSSHRVNRKPKKAFEAKRAGEFIADDVLDIEPVVQTQTT